MTRAEKIARKLIKLDQERDDMWAVSVADVPELRDEILIVFSPTKREAMRTKAHYITLLTKALRKAGVK